MKKMIVVALALFSIMLVSACSKPQTTVLSLNPYEDVDFDSVNHVLANLHTHTTHSDGMAMPHDVVDFYHELGYSILAITDHDLYTYPWTFSDLNPEWEDRDPNELGMVAIPGNEYSYNNNRHHITGLFSDYIADPSEEKDVTLAQVEETGGIAFFAHPGRYWKIFRDYSPGDQYSPEWYIDYFTRYDASFLVGMEVYSRNDYYQYDRALWDRLLSELMPERPIWGFGNDDYHRDSMNHGINLSFTYHLMEDPSSLEEFRQTLISGAFFTSHTAQVDQSAPSIERIIINTDERYIEIISDEAVAIKWFSGVDEHRMSVEVHEGNRFYYGRFEGNYVRAEVWKDMDFSISVTLTQPFGFTQEKTN